MIKKIALVAVACLGLAAFTSAQTLDEVLAKNYESRGGLDNIRAVKSVKISGTMVMGGGMEAPFTFYWKAPNKIRNEFTIQGMTGIQAFDGETGWMLMPFTGNKEPQKIPEELAKNMADEADFQGPLVDWKDKGHQVELVGTETVEGTEAYKIKITHKNGNVSFKYLDTEYGLEFKEEGKREVNGQEIEYETSTGDYKQVGNLVLPHSITTMAKGAPAGQTMTFDSIELDPEIDDSMFAMPQSESAEAPEEPAK